MYVIEQVQAALTTLDSARGPGGGPPLAFAKPDLTGLRNKLMASIHGAMKKAYESVLSSTPVPPGGIASGFESEFIVCGYANGTPWLLDFGSNGQVNWNTTPGFSAVGSGGPFATVAHGLMAHYVAVPLSLKLSTMVAYRAIETTCEVSPGGVGLPVQIAVVDDSGSRVLDDDEVREVGDAVAGWKTLELESLKMSAEDAKAGAHGDLPSIEDETTADN